MAGLKDFGKGFALGAVDEGERQTRAHLKKRKKKLRNGKNGEKEENALAKLTSLNWKDDQGYEVL